MFIFGHLWTIAHADLFPGADVLGGDHLLELLLPDIVSCHDWAYDEIWGPCDPAVPKALVRAHILGDAIVHFGPRHDPARRKTGWAYRQMGIVARGYKEFYRHAAEQDWLRERSLVPTDTRRGWAHSIVEYSIDQFLTDTRIDARTFARVKAAIGRELEGPERIDALLGTLGVRASKPHPEQARRYLSAMVRAQMPDELHLRGLAVKFGLIESEEVLAYLRSWTRAVVMVLGREHMEQVVAEQVTVLRDPHAFGYPV